MTRLALALVTLLFFAPVALAQGDAAALLAQADEALETFETKAGELPRLQAEFQAAGQAGDRARMAEIQRRGQALQIELRGLFEKAMSLYDRTIAADPEEGRAYTGKAALQFATGNLDAGAADVEKAIEFAPDHLPAYQLRATYRFGMMDWEGSLADAQRCIEGGHKVERMREIEANIRLYRGDFAGAAAIFDEFAAKGSEQARQVAKIARDYEGYAAQEKKIREAEAARDDLPRVKLVTDAGEIVVELYEDHAPNTVASFVSLVEKGFYDGIRFHRVIPNFMAQGGDPNSKDADPANDGQGGPGYRFADELGEGYRRHFAGVLSMANSGPDTNGSQFFLTFIPTWHLNGKHTVFGRIVEGMDVLYDVKKGTTITKAVVLRKRDHAYAPESLR